MSSQYRVRSVGLTLILILNGLQVSLNLIGADNRIHKTVLRFITCKGSLIHIGLLADH